MYCWNYYGNDPSVYGWGRGLIHILKEQSDIFGFEQLKHHSKNDSHAYTFTLNYDEYRLIVTDEGTKDHDEIAVGTSCASLPRSLFVTFGRMIGQVSFI